MLGKLCQPAVSWNQVLEMLFGLCNRVRNEAELPTCREHTYPHRHVHVCYPFPVHMCHGRSWPGSSFTDLC